MIKKRKKSSFSKFFWNKPYFFCLNLNSTWKMHSFDVYIVDIAQKLQNLKFFAIFWSNCTITVILQFFSAFCKKKILKMAFLNWKWSQLSGKCVFGALWRCRAKLDRGGIRCPSQCWQALSDVSLIRVKVQKTIAGKQVINHFQ